jgi:hypothetical protein
MPQYRSIPGETGRVPRNRNASASVSVVWAAYRTIVSKSNRNTHCSTGLQCTSNPVP